MSVMSGQMQMVSVMDDNTPDDDVKGLGAPHWLNRPPQKGKSGASKTPSAWIAFIKERALAQPEVEQRSLCLSIRREALEKGWSLEFSKIDEIVWDLRFPFVDNTPVFRRRAIQALQKEPTPPPPAPQEPVTADPVPEVPVPEDTVYMAKLEDFARACLPDVKAQTPFGQALAVFHKAKRYFASNVDFADVRTCLNRILEAE